MGILDTLVGAKLRLLLGATSVACVLPAILGVAKIVTTIQDQEDVKAEAYAKLMGIESPDDHVVLYGEPRRPLVISQELQDALAVALEAEALEAEAEASGE